MNRLHNGGVMGQTHLMVMKRSTLRHIFGWLAIPFVVILYFNIENAATRMGLDNILADAIAPRSGENPVADLLQNPIVLWCALVGLGFAAGLWVDQFLLGRRTDALTDLRDRARQAAVSVSEIASLERSPKYPDPDDYESKEEYETAKAEIQRKEEPHADMVKSRYMKECFANVQEILDEAARHGLVEESDMFFASHSPNHPQSLALVIKALSSIAARSNALILDQSE